MVPWDSAPVSHSFQNKCLQALGNFFHAFLKDKPWWVSLSKPVNDEDETCVYYRLGFNQSIGAEFMCSTGLIKVGHCRNSNATIVIKSEWDKFILEENLHDAMEAVNQASISGQRHFLLMLEIKRC
jgi:hypothetical protein